MPNTLAKFTQKENVFSLYQSSETQNKGAFYEDDPEFADLCTEHAEDNVWDFSASYAAQYLNKLMLLHDTQKNGKESRQFFSRSISHQILFWTLLLKASQSIANGSPRIGCTLEEVLYAMRQGDKKSAKTCQQIVSDGVDEDLIALTHWRKDKRTKVVYLTPQGLHQWVRHGAPLHAEIIVGTNLSLHAKRLVDAGSPLIEMLNENSG
jgi:hypothetical protein